MPPSKEGFGAYEKQGDILCWIMIALFVVIDIGRPLVVLMDGLRLGRG